MTKTVCTKLFSVCLQSILQGDLSFPSNGRPATSDKVNYVMYVWVIVDSTMMQEWIILQITGRVNSNLYIIDSEFKNVD